MQQCRLLLLSILLLLSLNAGLERLEDLIVHGLDSFSVQILFHTQLLFAALESGKVLLVIEAAHGTQLELSGVTSRPEVSAVLKIFIPHTLVFDFLQVLVGPRGGVIVLLRVDMDAL